MKARSIVDKLLEDEDDDDFDPRELFNRTMDIDNIQDLYDYLYGSGFRITSPWSVPGDEDYSEEDLDALPSIGLLQVKHGYHTAVISVEPYSDDTIDVSIRDLQGKYHSLPIYRFTLPSNDIVTFIQNLQSALESTDDDYNAGQLLTRWNSHRL